MEMRKCGVLAFCLVVLLGTTACSAGRDISPTYPRIEYRNSSYNLDPYNREIPIESEYVLDGTLMSWLASWKMKSQMLVAFLLENEKARLSELD